jgi:hypothetical protein
VGTETKIPTLLITISAILNYPEPVSTASRVHNPLIFSVNRGGVLRTGFRTEILNVIFVIHCQQIKTYPKVEFLLHVILRNTYFHIFRDFYPY